MFQVLVDGQIPANSQAISELLNSNRRDLQNDVVTNVTGVGVTKTSTNNPSSSSVMQYASVRPSPCPSPTGTLRFVALCSTTLLYSPSVLNRTFFIPSPLPKYIYNIKFVFYRY